MDSKLLEIQENKLENQSSIPSPNLPYSANTEPNAILLSKATLYNQMTAVKFVSDVSVSLAKIPKSMLMGAHTAPR